MNPEEIRELVRSTVSGQMSEGLRAGFGEFRSFFESQMTVLLEPVNEQLSGLSEFRDAMTAPEGEDLDGTPITDSTPITDDITTDDSTLLTEEEKMADPTVKALMERLAMLEAQNTEREQSLSKGRFTDALRKAISPENPLHSSMVEEVLANRLQSGLVETEGSFYNAKGQKLEELVQGFFSSPEGQHFKPAKSRQGMGEAPAVTNAPVAKKGEPTLDEMLRDCVF